MKLIKKTGWRNNESLQRHIESRNEANNQYDEFPFISKYCFITPGSHSIYRWMSKEGLLNQMQFVTVSPKKVAIPSQGWKRAGQLSQPLLTEVPSAPPLLPQSWIPSLPKVLASLGDQINSHELQLCLCVPLPRPNPGTLSIMDHLT